tara:strand:- start:200 stop:778 length:579 start_codon:yes stop_codon:yes gene_type:complete
MAVTITIGAEARAQVDSPDENPRNEAIPISLIARSTLDGNVVIKDHPDVDIIINPAESKVIAFSTDRRSDKVYDVQDRFFNFLASKGIIDRSKIQSGSVYGSMEAKYPTPNDQQSFSTLEVLFLVIFRFIEDESDFFSVDDEFEKEFEDSLTDPDEDESTELGEVPHADQKGAIRPGYIYSPYGISSIYRYE